MPTRKTKSSVAILDAALERAGFARGDALEIKVSHKKVTIVPKLSPDELQDEREIRDPKIRAMLREGFKEFRAGKTRPIEAFFTERDAASRKRSPVKA